MLSIFPSLLTFSIFAPFFLRLASGIFFFHRGYRHIGAERDALTQELSQRFSSFAGTLTVTLAAIEIVIGLFLIAGFLTQVMALLGAIFMLKLLWFKKSFPFLARHEKTVYILLCIILLSLLLTGPGAFAVDLPL